MNHKLRNPPRLTDADRALLDDDYSVAPACMDDEQIEQRDLQAPALFDTAEEEVA